MIELSILELKAELLWSARVREPSAIISHSAETAADEKSDIFDMREEDGAWVLSEKAPSDPESVQLQNRACQGFLACYDGLGKVRSPSLQKGLVIDLFV